MRTKKCHSLPKYLKIKACSSAKASIISTLHIPAEITTRNTRVGLTLLFRTWSFAQVLHREKLQCFAQRAITWKFTHTFHSGPLLAYLFFPSQNHTLMFASIVFVFCCHWTYQSFFPTSRTSVLHGPCFPPGSTVFLVVSFHLIAGEGSVLLLWAGVMFCCNVGLWVVVGGH